jgi:hypothetical protein
VTRTGVTTALGMGASLRRRLPVILRPVVQASAEPSATGVTFRSRLCSAIRLDSGDTSITLCPLCVCPLCVSLCTRREDRLFESKLNSEAPGESDND